MYHCVIFSHADMTSTKVSNTARQDVSAVCKRRERRSGGGRLKISTKTMCLAVLKFPPFEMFELRTFAARMDMHV